ncbi:MAG: hypothetical protein ACM31O_03415 [Bacteroidota bacterium]
MISEMTPERFLDLYGTCRALAMGKGCKCQRERIWRGRMCANWLPLGACDWEGLQDAQIALRGRFDKTGS